MIVLRLFATGTDADVIIPVLKASSDDHAVGADWTPGAGDVKISKDGGASANIGTLPVEVVDIGWKFVFTDTELTAKRINVTIRDTAVKVIKDDGFIIETYGDALAEHDTLTPAQVNAEVVDVLKVDVITLPGQATPPLTPTFEEAVAWNYKTYRNKKEQTAGQWSLFDDAGTTIDSKAAVSDDGVTATKEEIESGP